MKRYIILIFLLLIIPTIFANEIKPLICPTHLNRDINIPHESDNQKFYKCFKNGQIREMICNKDYVFDAESSNCIQNRIHFNIEHQQHASNQMKWNEILCLRNADNVRFPNFENNCHSYFICVNKKPISQLCPAGTLYDLNKNICNHPDEVHCMCTLDICPTIQETIIETTPCPCPTTTTQCPTPAPTTQCHCLIETPCSSETTTGTQSVTTPTAPTPIGSTQTDPTPTAPTPIGSTQTGPTPIEPTWSTPTNPTTTVCTSTNPTQTVPTTPGPIPTEPTPITIPTIKTTPTTTCTTETTYSTVTTTAPSSTTTEFVVTGEVTDPTDSVEYCPPGGGRTTDGRPEPTPDPNQTTSSTTALTTNTATAIGSPETSTISPPITRPTPCPPDESLKPIFN